MLLELLTSLLIASAAPPPINFVYTDTDPCDEYADYSYAGFITRYTPVYFRKICSDANKDNLTVRIIIDTFGGSAFAGQKLCRLSTEFSTHNIAGDLIGANSAGALWWMGGKVREFEGEFSSVSFHRSYAMLGGGATYHLPLLILLHSFEDNLIEKNMNPYVAKTMIQYLDTGKEFGPIAVVVFQNSPLGVVVLFDSGVKAPELLIKSTHISLDEWKQYLPQ